MSNRLYNAAIFNEVVYRPMKLITKPVVVIAGILLAALLLAPTFSVSAQTAVERDYRYAENRTDPVATFRADRDVKWTIRGPDADAFDINGGVLVWEDQPNYEDPGDVVGVAEDLNDNGDTEDIGEGAGVENDNVYQVNIFADGTFLVAATITVTDVDDAGKVSLTHLQPAEGRSVHGHGVRRGRRLQGYEQRTAHRSCQQSGDIGP